MAGRAPTSTTAPLTGKEGVIVMFTKCRKEAKATGTPLFQNSQQCSQTRAQAITAQKSHGVLTIWVNESFVMIIQLIIAFSR